MPRKRGLIGTSPPPAFSDEFMASYSSLGSSVAWYTGSVPEILELQANFHMVRRNLMPREPNRYTDAGGLYRALKPYYNDPDVLMNQCHIAEEMWQKGEMVYAEARKPGCQPWSHYEEMKEAACQAEQLNIHWCHPPVQGPQMDRVGALLKRRQARLAS